MITFEQALEIVLKRAKPRFSEKIGLKQCSGRILGIDLVSGENIPNHRLSAMDGYACRTEDNSSFFNIIESIPAGYVPLKTVGKGQCSRIMTGAWVPEGAGRVVMLEHTKLVNGRVKITVPDKKSNIRNVGEEITEGSIVVGKGAVITPARIAVLAALGCDPVTVYSKPTVGILATGDELVKPSRRKKGAFIPDSNSYQLLAHIKECGCIPKLYGIARDKPGEIDKFIKKALQQSDVLIISGGVSVGDYDYVPSVLKDNGVKLHFGKIAVKPGKPTVFGTKGARFIFGLPGNPVSTFVMFTMLVKPLLYKLMGHDYTIPFLNGVAEETIERRDAQRTQFIPVAIDGDRGVKPVGYKGSAHIHAITDAQGIIRIEQGVRFVPKGSSVKVFLTGMYLNAC